MRTSINKKSDFDFIVLDNEGNAVDMPSNDFTIDLWTWGSKCRFRASSIGGVLKGCKSDNGKLRVYVDNPGFVPGKLVGEWVSYVSSEEHPDGSQRTCRYISDFGIDMVDGDSTTNEQQVLAMMQYIQGESAYEIACEYGYQGTEEEWLNSLSLESVNAANECRELMAQLSAAEDVRNANEQTRIANEQARVESEGSRSYEEDRRADAERTRIHNESVRHNSEKIRQDAENYRITHENSRESNETMRQNSETARAAAEESRVAAEESRQTAEQARETAEVSRAAAEGERKRTHDRLKTAMREYADAESLREEAEAERREAEQYRIEYEQSRQSAEADRLTNERSRVATESQRVTNETARQEAEQGRVTNEQARVAAETNRETAETNRVNAEQQRVEAEQARAEEFAGFSATLAAKEDVANKVTSINADADDVHYPSAKAVKDEIARIDMSVKGQECNYISGYYVLSNGSLTKNEMYFVNKMLPCESGDEVTYITGKAVAIFLCFYDSNKKFISYFQNFGGRTITAPDNAKYIQASFINEYKQNAEIKINGVSVFKPEDEIDGVSLRLDRLISSIPSDIGEKLLNAEISTFSFTNNGSFGNSGNPNYVYVRNIPTNGSDKIYININRKFGEGDVAYSIGNPYFTDVYDDTSNPVGGDPHIYRHLLFTENDWMCFYNPRRLNYVKFIFCVYKNLNGSTNEELFNSVRITDENLANTIKVCYNYNKGLSAGRLDSAYERNKDKEVFLRSSCRLNKYGLNNDKDFQIAIITDTHGDVQAVRNASDMTKSFRTIDALIHCGDFVSGNATEVNTYVDTIRALRNCGKPWFVVVGNHDVGNSANMSISCTNEEAYTRYIKPMVDDKILANGEYVDNKPYYFHDFTKAKVRLVVPYEYYDDNSNNGTSYNVIRGVRVIRKEQLDWFANTLLTTPSGFGIIVAMHNPFSKKANAFKSKFTQKNVESLINGNGMQDQTNQDVFADIVNAYVNGASYNETITFSNNTDSYVVSYDFSSKQSDTSFYGYIGGHRHADIVWRHQTYINQYQVCPACGIGTGPNANICDISRTTEFDVSYDSLTVASFAKKRIALVKLGNNVTYDGYVRDYDVITYE